MILNWKYVTILGGDKTNYKTIDYTFYSEEPLSRFNFKSKEIHPELAVVYDSNLHDKNMIADNKRFRYTLSVLGDISILNKMKYPIRHEYGILFDIIRGTFYSYTTQITAQAKEGNSEFFNLLQDYYDKLYRIGEK